MGNRTAARSVVRFFLSNDAVLGPGDLLLSQQHLGPLPAGTTRRITFLKRFRFSTSGRFLIAVLDARNEVPELNEANNIVPFGPIL